MKILYRTKQLILLLGDVVVFFVAFLLAFWLRSFQIPAIETLLLHSTLFAMIFFVWVVVNYINGLYDLSFIDKKRWYQRVLEAGIMAFLASILLLYLHPQRDITPKTLLVLNVIVGYGLSIVWRAVFHKAIGYRRLRTSILIVGYSEEIRELLSIVKKHPEKSYEICAIVDPEKHFEKQDLPKGTSMYQSYTAIRPAITKHNADIVVAAPHLTTDQMVVREMYELLFWPVRMIDFYTLYETLTNRVSPGAFSEDWFLSNLSSMEKPVYNKFRRLINYIASVALGIVFVLLLPFVALAIKLNSKGPVFLQQKRVGEGGREFMMYKFRTMYALNEDGSAETDGAQFASKDDKRITGVGKILRKMRIDEIPQVINLAKGDLTLIGPRPERPEIVEQLTEQMPYYPLRHIVKPGITGWAAIHQNYTDNFKTSLEKLQYDLYYIKNRGVLTDLSIMLRTVNVVMRMMGQ